MPKLLLISAAAASLALAGCAAYGTNTNSASSSSETSYTAQGNEPGWTLTVDRGFLNYTGDYGQTKIRVPFSAPVQENGRTVYATSRLRVTAEPVGCDDSMVERRYRDRVTVVADGKHVTGCGGPVAAPTTLDGTSWTILRVGGKAVVADSEANLQFAEGRLSGTAGCNRIMSGYVQNGAAVRFTQGASTMMACPGPLMEQERAVLSVLGGDAVTQFNDDGSLHIRGADGTVLELRQSF